MGIGQRTGDERARWPIMCGWAIAVTMCLFSWAHAHTSLEHYIREDVAISVGQDNVDIRIQFEFPAAYSLVERKAMDTDRDGKLTSAERRAYLLVVAQRAERQLLLKMDGKEVLLIPLEDPVVDLLDEPSAEAHPHVLRLAYFARTPKDFGQSHALSLDSALWADGPLLLSVSFEASEGIRMRAVDAARGLQNPCPQGTMLHVATLACDQWIPRNKLNGRN